MAAPLRVPGRLRAGTPVMSSRPASVTPRPSAGGATPRGATPRPASAGGAVLAAKGVKAKVALKAPEVSAEDWLEAELQKVVGLEKVKEQMRAFLKGVRLERRRQELGLPVTSDALDMVFYGNPGAIRKQQACMQPESCGILDMMDSYVT